MESDTANVGALSNPRNKAELMERIQLEWTAMEQAISHLSDEQMSLPGTGGWSVKDNLAHVTAWEQFMLLSYLQGRPEHEVMQVDEAILRTLDINGLNEVLYQRNKDRPPSAVLAGLRRSHEQVLAALEQMSFANLMKPLYADDPEARLVIGEVIGNTYEHYREHRAAIWAIIEHNSWGQRAGGDVR
jgi:hypothetical protein